MENVTALICCSPSSCRSWPTMPELLSPPALSSYRATSLPDQHVSFSCLSLYMVHVYMITNNSEACLTFKNICVTTTKSYAVCWTWFCSIQHCLKCVRPNECESGLTHFHSLRLYTAVFKLWVALHSAADGHRLFPALLLQWCKNAVTEHACTGSLGNACKGGHWPRKIVSGDRKHDLLWLSWMRASSRFFREGLKRQLFSVKGLVLSQVRAALSFTDWTDKGDLAHLLSQWSVLGSGVFLCCMHFEEPTATPASFTSRYEELPSKGGPAWLERLPIAQMNSPEGPAMPSFPSRRHKTHFKCCQTMNPHAVAGFYRTTTQSIIWDPSLEGATFEVSLGAALPETQESAVLQGAKLYGHLSASWWSLHRTFFHHRAHVKYFG